MHTLSSARRTCMASASAVECTATVAMPSSRQARCMRSAISPLLAIRILSNMRRLSRRRRQRNRVSWRTLFYDDQRFAIFDWLGVIDEDGRNGPGTRRRDLVHCLHGFDNEQRVALVDLAADFTERSSSRFRRTVGGADHRRFHGARMLREIAGRGWSDDRLVGL